MQRNAFLAMTVLALLACFGAVPAVLQAAAQDYASGSLARLKLHAHPRVLPDVDFLNEQGKPVTLSSFKGKMTIVVLWATWCPYCIAELPSLNRMQEHFGKDKLNVLAIAVDRDGYKKPRAFLDDHGYTNLALYSDPESMVGSSLGTRGIPYALFFNSEGREIGRLPGSTDWMDSNVLDFVSFYLDKN